MCPTGTESQKYETVQKSSLRSAFDVLDVDGDGKISYDDLRTFYGGVSDEDVIGSMMSAADSNKDGFVEYEEFQKVLNKSGNANGHGRRTGGGVGDVMEEAFRVMDRDGDGKVGLQDLRSYMNWAGFDQDDEDFKAMIRLAGGEENGGVTLEGLLKILAV